MNLEEAKSIIFDNYLGNEGSLVYSLHEENYFSIEKYWLFYDSIACLANKHFNNEEISKQIFKSYQQLLKEIIYHFDPSDLSVLDNLPDNYIGYIERLEFVLLAYYESKPVLLDDDIFEVKR